jgi:amino-acid N-acetyltransferase
MVTADKLERLRAATIDDAAGIIGLIEPLEAEGILVYRGRELIEREIQRFFVLEHDGVIVGCAALYPFPSGNAAELAALAVRPESQGLGYGEKLLEHASAEAKRRGLRRLFVLTTQATRWFIERGFTEQDPTTLPEERRSLYNYQRRSKVLAKKI